MKLNFRIDWGYQYLYSRRHYHPIYRWDGGLSCTGGSIEKCFRLDYPVIWFGPGHCAHETELATPRWESTTRRGLAGVRIEAEVEKDAAIFRLETLSCSLSFRADDLLKQGRLVFPVGPKYLGCSVIVTLDRYFWFLPPKRAGRREWLADDLAASVPVRDWARMRTAWIEPGGRMAFTAEIATSDADHVEQILHIVAMGAPGYTPGNEQVVHDSFPIRLYCDGELVASETRYYREHDDFMQMLEDMWLRFEVKPGSHRFELENGNARFCFLVTRMTLQASEHNHLDLSLPAWALCGEELIGRVYAVREDRTEISWPGGSMLLDVKPGWNEFRFRIEKPQRDAIVSTTQSMESIPAVYDLPNETPEVMVGYDMTTVPHDRSGSMDWLLDYTWRTRLGNIVVFRTFERLSPETNERRLPDDDLLERWGAFCRDHHIYVEAANCFDSGALVKAAGPMLHSVGRHEWPGAVYAFDPSPEWMSEDMEEAMNHFIARLKLEIDRAHKVSPRMAFGDASGAHRYCYMAGADFIRSETMVPHSQHLLSQARPAAESLGPGEWGVHIAIQHPVQPYFPWHLRQYFLSLFQPWMMGASMIYEEDSLFELFKEERQAWDDALTKGKRDMTRDFFRFVKTHPRRGRIRRPIAFVEGRYAAPFNGFICDVEQTPDYSVWGLFGNPDPTWGHRQPEKCRQLLDILMPGASTQPLRQDFTKRRFFFSGTPYGDFDEVPTEASADYMRQYDLLLHLGWNTMIQEDYEKLKTLVADHATLVIGLPEFSTHKKRQFLAEMTDLALWNGGDLSELCGVRVIGPGPEFCGEWNGIGRADGIEPDLSGIPSSSITEDGPCRLAEVELCGAEPVLWDANTGKPLVVRNRCGNGTVYLITAYAYPGHEALRRPIASFLAGLCAEYARRDIFLEELDGTNDVFWNVRTCEDGTAILMALNTDWTTPENERRVRVTTPAVTCELAVCEGTPAILTVLPFAVVRTPPAVHMEILSCTQSEAEVRVHGDGHSEIEVIFADNVRKFCEVDFDKSETTCVKLKIAQPERA